MRLRINLLDFLSVYNGQLTRKGQFNLHPSVKLEEFLAKYCLDAKLLDKMRLAVAAGNFKVLEAGR
jgi:hypothetical protein